MEKIVAVFHVVDFRIKSTPYSYICFYHGQGPTNSKAVYYFFFTLEGPVKANSAAVQFKEIYLWHVFKISYYSFLRLGNELKLKLLDNQPAAFYFKYLRVIAEVFYGTDISVVFL